MDEKKSILSAKYDIIFKKVFKSPDVLTGLLKSVLDLPDEDYDEIEIVDPHLPPDSPEEKLGILDIKIHTKSKKIVDVEIQLNPMTAMRERIIFYTSKMITEQIQKSDLYQVIQRVISIVITDYTFIDDNDYYHNRYRLYDSNTGSLFSNILEINTLELPKLPTNPDDTKL